MLASLKLSEHYCFIFATFVAAMPVMTHWTKICRIFLTKSKWYVDNGNFWCVKCRNVAKDIRSWTLDADLFKKLKMPYYCVDSVPRILEIISIVLYYEFPQSNFKPPFPPLPLENFILLPPFLPFRSRERTKERWRFWRANFQLFSDFSSWDTILLEIISVEKLAIIADFLKLFVIGLVTFRLTLRS